MTPPDNEPNTSDKLSDEIGAIIKGFSAKQAVFFANLCAIRVLPFLCATETVFLLWAHETQRHLDAIFNAIDVNLKYSSGKAASADIYVTAAYADAYAAAAYTDDAYVAYAAAATAYIAYITEADSLTDDAADIITNIAAGVIDKQNSLKDIILSDIDLISKNDLSSLNNDKKTYDDVWDKFQAVLSTPEVNCSHWATFYDKLFTNGFVVDIAD